MNFRFKIPNSRLRLLPVIYCLLPIAWCLFPVASKAQLWSGIIAPSRATDWSTVGATIPTNRTQCGSTIASYNGTAATINTALAACANNTFLLLGVGTFNLTTGIDFQGRSNVTLRGSGGNQTFLVFTGYAGCSGLLSAVCVEGDNSLFDKPSDLASDNSASWTATSYAASQTQITLGAFQHGSIANLQVGNPIILDQCDSGLSGTTCGTGTDVDTGQVWICELQSQGCSDDGTNASGGQRPNRAQEQIVKVTAISGNLVTFTPGLRMPNWSASDSPQAFWSSLPNHDDGVENLSLDITNSGVQSGIVIWNCYNCWVKGVRSIYTTHNAASERNHVWIVLSPHVTVRDSYFFGSASLSLEGYGVETFGGGDDLIENNIFQQMPSPQMINSNCSGCVVGYNYSINDSNSANYLFNSLTLHAPVDNTLVEGNIGNSYRSDLFHGSHNFNTAFRNYYNGWETTPINNGFTADYLDPASRYYNMIGNVFGQPSFFTCYQETPTIPCAQWPVYTVGTGTTTVQTGGDALTVNSLMRWGNYDTFNSATHFLSSEVPSSFSDSTGNPSIFVNAVPANDNLPASFYYSSKPAWWPSGKPWPAIGPDVTGGNIAGLNGHAYTIPAEDCYTNVMGGPANGTGSALNFNASICYSTSDPNTGGGSVIACGGGSGVSPCVSGKVTSSACAGGPPQYCADSSLRVILQSQVTSTFTDPNDGGPAVGVPFVDPDFGARIVRVTDANSVNLYPAGSVTSNTLLTDSSSESNTFSVFDPSIGTSGGYRFDIGDSHGNWVVFTLDATTMQTQYLEPLPTNGYWSFHDPYVFFYAGGASIDYYCMPGNPAGDPYCGGTTGAKTLFTVNSTSCPNLPSSTTPAFGGEMSISKDDNSFGDFWGNTTNHAPLTIYYNKVNSHCDWYNTINGQVGGSDYTGVQQLSFGPVPAPVAAPTLTPITGTGTLPAGTYCVAETIITDNLISGLETTPGVSSCLQLTATGEITVNLTPKATDSITLAYFPNSPTALYPLGWNVYACMETSPPATCSNFTLQNPSILGWSPVGPDCSPQLSPASTYNISAPLSTSTAAPTVNNGGYAIHNTRISWSGTYVTNEGEGCPGSLLVMWNAGTTNAANSNDSGHYVAGYTYAARNWDNWLTNFLATNMSTGTTTNRTTQPSGYHVGGNGHISWSDDNPSDTYPLLYSTQAQSSSTVSGWSAPNGAQPNATLVRWPQASYNPALTKYAPYFNEIIAGAMDGTSTVWRFCNERSSSNENWNSGSPAALFYVAQVLGNQSQDGKFAMFTSAWEWGLGTFGIGGWQPNHSFSSGAQITDSNGNLETANGSGISGSALPSWSTTIGGITNDGSITGGWTMSHGGCPYAGQCRGDVFIVQTR